MGNIEEESADEESSPESGDEESPTFNMHTDEKPGESSPENTGSGEIYVEENIVDLRSENEGSGKEEDDDDSETEQSASSEPLKGQDDYGRADPQIDQNTLFDDGNSDEDDRGQNAGFFPKGGPNKESQTFNNNPFLQM
jgi:hypothetical protein